MFIISKSWFELLKPELTSEKFTKFSAWLNNEYKTTTIYPKPENVFAAINHVPYDKVKVVIVGQDPYHQPNQAHGLSFSVEGDVASPPSLQNIFKELKSELNCYIPNNGNLTKWAKQGVLMLNSVLTVQQGKPNSHKGLGWEQITTATISLLNKREDPVIFLLWGANAKAMLKNIDENKHIVFTASHPSPMSANQGGWFGNGCFKKTNEKLVELNKQPIDWQIENR